MSMTNPTHKAEELPEGVEFGDQSVPERLRSADCGADLADELRTNATHLRESDGAGSYDIAALLDEAAEVVEWAGDKADGLTSRAYERKVAELVASKAPLQAEIERLKGQIRGGWAAIGVSPTDEILDNEDHTLVDAVELLSRSYEGMKVAQTHALRERNQATTELDDLRAELVPCPNCEGTGYYEEGEEWTPCDQCDLGERIGHRQDIVREEAKALALAELREKARTERRKAEEIPVDGNRIVFWKRVEGFLDQEGESE